MAALIFFFRRIYKTAQDYRRYLRDTHQTLWIALNLAIVITACGDIAVLWFLGLVAPAIAAALKETGRWMRVLLFGALPALILLGGLIADDWNRIWRRNRSVDELETSQKKQ